MLKKFPIDIETLQGESGIEVYVLNKWKNANFVTTLKHLPSNTITAKVLNDGYSLFKNVAKGEDYLIEVQFSDPLKRLKYKSKKTKIKYSGPKNLRIIGTGSGRCGTSSFAKYLDGMRFANRKLVRARHESMSGLILEKIRDKATEEIKHYLLSFQHNVEISPYFSLIPEILDVGDKVVLIIRDGRKVVASGMARGWYSRASIWDQIKPDFEGTTFEKCCHLWRHTNENVINKADIVIKLEDLISNNLDEKFYKILGLSMVQKEFPKTNKSKNPPQYKWSKDEFSDFKRICGHLMDQYYSGWENDSLIKINS
ncbi:hypothetical protein DSCW_03830 [Desulfosarcina widdelii]|uniref:Sulfotransferase domain-containing protein n=1 Tax=Desulfosarcina widdelii TaxID=947919 RepID=A0A5K7YUJ8_9BACT|nr:hypothetical protein [Desulfosarcina widdelii]BBO72966.1 hypothetical protein DSCW_03830 [Desulfosarcina widdelii]